MKSTCLVLLGCFCALAVPRVLDPYQHRNSANQLHGGVGGLSDWRSTDPSELVIRCVEGVPPENGDGPERDVHVDGRYLMGLAQTDPCSTLSEKTARRVPDNDDVVHNLV